MLVFNTLFPILAIGLVGYLVSRLGLLSQKESKGISKLTFSLLIPVMLFYASATAAPLDASVWPFLCGFFSSVILVYVFACISAKLIFGYRAQQQSVLAMGAAYSNALIVGIPIVVISLGEAALLPAMLIISIHNIVLFTLGFLSAERSSLKSSHLVVGLLAVAKRLVRNPIVMSLVAGAMINFIGLTFHVTVATTFKLISQASIPLALFSLGLSLNSFSRTESLASLWKPVALITGLKLLLLPLLVWLALFYFLEIDPLWASTALLISAMPTGINSYLFAQQYSVLEAPITASIFISTVISIFTISLLLNNLIA